MSLASDYQRDGCVVCRDLVDADTVAALRDETVAIACGLEWIGGDSSTSKALKP